MLLRNKLSCMIFIFNVYFKMAASIGSHFENVKFSNICKSKNQISMQFTSNCAVFQILLDKLPLNFCVPFPLIWFSTTMLVNICEKLNLMLLQSNYTSQILYQGILGKTLRA